MDKEFMKSYYDLTYEERIMVQILQDSQFQEESKIITNLINDLENTCGGWDSSLWKQIMNLFEHKNILAGIEAKLSYVIGAEDREQMLR